MCQMQQFYNWLKTQFTDIESAKVFFNKIKDNCETPYGPFTQRAMCYHISQVLEGKEYKEIGQLTNYSATKYGVEIYTNDL